MIRIRLARLGRKHLPFYRIFIAEAKAKRDGRHIDVVGYYDPIPAPDGNKHVGLNFDKIKYWLAVGAQPSAPVTRILERVGLMPSKKRRMHVAEARATSADIL